MTIRGNNEPTVNMLDQSFFVKANVEWQYIVPLNSFIDIENDPLTYRACEYTGTDCTFDADSIPAYDANNPLNLSFDTSLRKFRYTPGEGVTKTFRVYADDSIGASYSNYLTISFESNVLPAYTTNTSIQLKDQHAE